MSLSAPEAAPHRADDGREGAPPSGTIAPLRPAGRLRATWVVAGVVAVVAACLAGVALGPVDLPLLGVVRALADRLPGVELTSGLSDRDLAILWQLRMPRVVLGLLVGAMLAGAGTGFQGAFRNPLADPLLLGIATGAGLGATLAIVYLPSTAGWWIPPLPLAAFAGALSGVAATYLLSRSVTGGRGTVELLLAGIAVAAFFSAAQTFVQMRNTESIRQIYAWLLGRLATSGWSDVTLILPYVAVTTVVLLAHRRLLDVIGVGDREALALGVPVTRVRTTVIVAAALGTAAAVAVSGLIGFVGIIVPHAVRLLVGWSYRSVLPLALLFGAAFLVLADLLARTVLAPAEIPIGVVTAFIGAPFFVVVLRHGRAGT
ncbi:iron ABC transporter permease [soil metagenome]